MRSYRLRPRRSTDQAIITMSNSRRAAARQSASNAGRLSRPFEVEHDEEIELFARSAPTVRLLITSQLRGSEYFTGTMIPIFSNPISTEEDENLRAIALVDMALREA